MTLQLQQAVNTTDIQEAIDVVTDYIRQNKHQALGRREKLEDETEGKKQRRDTRVADETERRTSESKQSQCRENSRAGGTGRRLYRECISSSHYYTHVNQPLII